MSPHQGNSMRTPWGLVALMVIVMTISFIDRGNLSVAAPAMVAEVKLSSWAMGVLLSAFFWTYALFQIVSGWLSDRFEVRWVYAFGFLIWTAATISTGLVSTFALFLAFRLLLGIGESVTYPATSRILAAVVPENRRGLANSLVDLGARVGPAAGIFLGATLLTTGQGWRAIFFLTGTLGVLWLIPWVLVAPRKLTAASGSSGLEDAGLSWNQLLRSKSVWGTCGGLCGANYSWYFLLTWLPTYLVKERQISYGSLAFLGTLPFLLMVVSSLGCGLLADRLISKGGSPVKVRKAFLVIGLSLTAVFMLGVLSSRGQLAIVSLMIACFTFGIYASNLFALTQALAGAGAAGRWTGLQNACGNLAGIVSPMFTGWIVERTGTFAMAFVCAGIACLAGAASFGLLVGNRPLAGSASAPQAWPRK
jgi:ACS family D-galactonate transporter-like MFS transporter